MVKQASTEDISIVRKHTWQVPFRITLYEIKGRSKFVLLEGGKRKAAGLVPTSGTDVNMGLIGVGHESDKQSLDNSYLLSVHLEKLLPSHACQRDRNNFSLADGPIAVSTPVLGCN